MNILKSSQGNDKYSLTLKSALAWLIVVGLKNYGLEVGENEAMLIAVALIEIMSAAGVIYGLIRKIGNGRWSA